jgi:NADH-quinone oxidoreductase subunit J
MGNVIFYILAAIAVISGFIVVTRKNAINAALYLVVAMAAIAGLFAQLGSLFVAALQIIVYAGAIIVLFLFVIMMLNLKRDEFGFDSRLFQRGFGLIVGIILIIQLVIIGERYQSQGSAMPIDPAMGNAAAMSKKLFMQYLYPFEIVSVLLLAAIIGAVVLAGKRKDS